MTRHRLLIAALGLALLIAALGLLLSNIFDDSAPPTAAGGGNLRTIAFITAYDYTPRKTVVGVCPDGTRAISGGYRTDPPTPQLTLQQSIPMGTNWTVTVRANGVRAQELHWRLIVTIVCADIPGMAHP
jgi:hypothetical protein